MEAVVEVGGADTGGEAATQPDVLSHYFRGLVLDDLPELLIESYRLRYQVYCLERGFLPADDYLDGIETDVFDAHAVHIGVVNSANDLVATARLVRQSEDGLPMSGHCAMTSQEAVFNDPASLVVEVSRLAVSRDYNRRKGDDFYSLQGRTTKVAGREQRRRGGEIVLTLYRALYQASKRHGFTHWLAATERSLQRLVAGYAFPFKPIGPEVDYFGMVAPYLMDLSEFDRVIMSRRIPLLGEFLAGLESRFRPDFDQASDDLVLQAFRRAADKPWYRTLLDEAAVRVDEIVDTASFSARCPPLSKRNTFDRFPLAGLCAGHAITGLASVLTSSGHGGRFSFGLSTREQAEAGADLIDQALDAAFKVRTWPTLAINCLPMGVGFSSRCMTVATTSVREDMAVALVEAFGAEYAQLLLVGDPLFMKRLLDHASERGVDWKRHRVHVVLGEETFGEHFRDYVARCLGLDVDCPDDGYIMSSFGVGELGLHLCHETPACIAVRRAARRNQELAADLFGMGRTGLATPMVFTFNPARTFMEVLSPDADGYGQLAISMLDAELPIPLLRYTTGDVVRLIDAAAVESAMKRRDMAVPADLPLRMIVLVGRSKDTLPNGFNASIYKDALYADATIARSLSGAFRLVFDGTICTMHVQLSPSARPDASFEMGLLDVLSDAVRPAHVHLWPYHRFPFGMTIDYERKFAHYVPGETDPR